MDVRSRVTIDLGAIRANARHLRAVAGGDLYAVVKADGYGHGALAVGRAAVEAGAAALCVATVPEGRALAAALPGVRVLVLSPLAPGDERDVDGLEVVVSTAEVWERVRDRPGLAVHVKADTGMGRWGLDAEQALAIGLELAARPDGPRLAGLMSHLATAEDPHQRYALAQVAAFRALADAFPPCPRHLANSAGTLRIPEARLDAVRCGIALYGVSPSDDDPCAEGLAPALTWESRVALLRDLPAGASTGYGRAFRAREATRVALVPVGYADGFPRPAAGSAEVLVRGRRRTVVAVAMDQLAVRLEPTDGDVRAGDRVVLLGADGDDRVGPEELARHVGTIGYEIVCGLRERAWRGSRVVAEGDA